MIGELTGSQKSALLWLRNRGCDGVFDKTNVLIAAGERAGVVRATWNALAANGLLEFYANRRRVRVTEIGKSVDLSRVMESNCKERYEDA